MRIYNFILNNPIFSKKNFPLNYNLTLIAYLKRRYLIKKDTIYYNIPQKLNHFFKIIKFQ